MRFSSSSYNYCSADNFSSKYNSGSAFGSKHGGQVGLAGGVGLGLAMRNPSLAMNAGSFGLGVGDKFGGTIGGYGGYGVAAAQCGAQLLGQSFANSGGMLMHF